MEDANVSQQIQPQIHSSRTHLKPFIPDPSIDSERCSKNKKIGFIKQLGIALVIGSCNFMQGFAEGWTANLPKIQEDESTNEHFNLTMYDVQWLVSGMYLSAMPSNLVGGAIGDVVGYKRLLTIILPVAIILWAMLAYTTTLWLMYFTRICLGLLFGLVSVLVSPLISEICEPEVRGFAIVIAELVLAIGVILGYLQAHLLYWRTATILCTLPMVPTLIILLFVPESPYWYLRHGKNALAEKSLEFILGKGRMHRKIDILQDMKLSKSNETKPSIISQLRLLRYSQNWKPLVLMVTIFFLRESGGKSSIFVYTVYLFRSAGVTVDPFVCTLFVGVSRLLTILVCAVIIDKVGRKAIFMTCTFICVLSLITAGGVLMADFDNLFTKWVPLIAVLTYTISYCLGMSPIPWPLAAELLPLPVKPVSVSIVCFTYSVSLFAMTNVFPTLLDTIGLGAALLMFSASYILLFIILAVFLPESKGKTLTELEKIFSSDEQKIEIQPAGIAKTAC